MSELKKRKNWTLHQQILTCLEKPNQLKRTKFTFFQLWLTYIYVKKNLYLFRTDFVFVILLFITKNSIDIYQNLQA